jgi:C-terminal processing protease CtpA/Prc
MSYLFSEPNLPLFSIVPRSGAPTVERTLQADMAFRDETRPVYVLVSGKTWSAGEGVPYILQERHRAKVIGEKTAGAANPAAPYDINQALTVTIPFGHIESAVRGRNWEGAGVEPDTVVSADKAFQSAYIQALEDLLARTANVSQKQRISNALANAGK